MTLTHDLDRIEGFARVATPGPWKPYDGRGLDAPADCIDFAVVSGHSVKETARVWTEDDARFIAALDPTTVLAMITRIRELEGQVTEATGLLDKFVPAYEAWMDRYTDDTRSSIYRTASFPDIRRARDLIERAALQRKTS